MGKMWIQRSHAPEGGNPTTRHPALKHFPQTPGKDRTSLNYYTLTSHGLLMSVLPRLGLETQHNNPMQKASSLKKRTDELKDCQYHANRGGGGGGGILQSMTGEAAKRCVWGGRSRCDTTVTFDVLASNAWPICHSHSTDRVASQSR